VAIQYGVVHWIVTALAYVLAGIGYFMLFELFVKAGQRTRTLGIPVTGTGLPVFLNLLGSSTAVLPNVGYEPLGVAAFAVGILYVFADRFAVVRIATDFDDPAVYLDPDGRIRDFNEPAAALFPEFREALDRPLTDTLPAVAGLLDAEEPVLQRDDHYFRVTTNSLTLGQSEVGETVVLSDVTDEERNRRELERQNERLERFASVVSPSPSAARKPSFSSNSWTGSGSRSPWGTRLSSSRATCSSSPTRTAPASCSRTSSVTPSTPAARTSRSRSAPARTTRGSPLPTTARASPLVERDDVFETGYSTAQDGTGFGLAIVAEIAEAHGWRVDVSESEAGGARFDVVGVESVW
jgi:hypothetical protein